MATVAFMIIMDPTIKMVLMFTMVPMTIVVTTTIVAPIIIEVHMIIVVPIITEFLKTVTMAVSSVMQAVIMTLATDHNVIMDIIKELRNLITILLSNNFK